VAALLVSPPRFGDATYASAATMKATSKLHTHAAARVVTFYYKHQHCHCQQFTTRQSTATKSTNDPKRYRLLFILAIRSWMAPRWETVAIPRPTPNHDDYGGPIPLQRSGGGYQKLVSLWRAATGTQSTGSFICRAEHARTCRICSGHWGISYYWFNEREKIFVLQSVVNVIYDG
jgi:hypothetical protein